MCHNTVGICGQAEQARILLTWSLWLGREANCQMWGGEKRHLEPVRGLPWRALGICTA